MVSSQAISTAASNLPERGISSSVCPSVTWLGQILETLLMSSLLVPAGCNSNSMWKLFLFQWKCCYLQRATEHNAKPGLCRDQRYSPSTCVRSWGISHEPIQGSAGTQGDDLWIDSQWLSHLPVSSVGHCCVCLTDLVQTLISGRFWFCRCHQLCVTVNKVLPNV